MKRSHLILLAATLGLLVAAPAASSPGAETAPFSFTRYLAEGNTGADYDEYLTLLNPGSAPAAATLTYYLASGAPVTRSLTVAAASRSTVAVNDSGLGVGPGQAVSVKVDSDQFLVVERPLYFDYQGRPGGSVAMAADAPATTWYFAAGQTSPGFDEYLSLLNPGPAPASVTLTYYFPVGAPVSKGLTVAASSRATVVVHDPELGVGRGQAVSTRVQASVPIVAERPMYFDYNGWTGGHDIVGATAPAATWYFAEGYTAGGFDEYLTLLNPGTAPASVNLTYYLTSGALPVKTLALGPGARLSVPVHDGSLGVGRNLAVSTRVQADQPIVAERSMYFSYPGPDGTAWTGGHSALGATAPALVWSFAEGSTRPGFDEYLALLNPGASPANVTVTYFLDRGDPLTRSLLLPAASRYTVPVYDDTLGVGRGRTVSAVVQADEPIVAERTLYFNYNQSWSGGDVSLGYPSAPALALELALAGLQGPTFVTGARDGTNRLFVVEKDGAIRVAVAGQLQPQPFLDIKPLVNASDTEQGMVGLAFHPRYRENGLFFVAYTGPGGESVVARYHVSPDPNRADPASATTVLSVPHPTYTNHNVGNLAFGPDGYLYIGTGDGGGGGDPFRNAQNRQSLRGKLLRLDIDHGDPYAIPPDNPFVSQANTRPEIWALGLRNPWRYSFDPATGDLFIADVGQDKYEEIDWQPAGSRGGENYGWSRMEGAHCYPAGSSCDSSGLVAPVAEYDHSQGCATVGGYVYRGQTFPTLAGAFLYGDYCSGRIWALHHQADGTWLPLQLLKSSLRISSLGVDDAGEIYAADLVGGGIYHLTARPR